VAAEGVPALPAGLGAVLAVAGLAAGGTLLPFTLFAYAQGRVSAEVAGAFLNLEPLVGAVAGVVVFGDPAGPVQLAGGAAILAGIALSSLPLLATGRRGRTTGERRQDTRRPRPRLLSQRPQPKSARRRSPQPQRPQPQRPQPQRPQPQRPQPRSPQARSPQARSPQARSAGGPQARSPQSQRPQDPSTRPRSPQSQRPQARRPPPGPGSARRAASRRAARACRWSFTGRRGRLQADRGDGARCRPGIAEPPPPPGRARCRPGIAEPLPPPGRARCRPGIAEPPPPPGRCGATLPLSLAAAPAAARERRGPICPRRWGTW
jgi:EamA-like transporter family